MHQNISKWEITFGNHPNDDHKLGCLCRNSDADIIDVAPDQWDQQPVGPLSFPTKLVCQKPQNYIEKKKWTIANTADSQYKFEREFLWNRWDAKVRDTNWWVQNTTLVDVPLPWRSAKSDNVRPIRAPLGANVDTRRFNWLSSKVRFLSSGSDGKSPGFTDVG